MSIKTLMSDRFSEEVSNFLGGVIIPADKFPNSTVELCFLSENDIVTVLPEEPPQRFLSRAVVDETRTIVFSVFSVEEEHCAGHFPNFPILPMAKLGQIMAQAGSILALSLDDKNGDKDRGQMVALVSSVESIKSFSPLVKGKKKYFLVPGDHLALIASIVSDRVTTKSLSIGVYIDGEIVNSMELTYSIMTKILFEKLYQRQRQTIKE